MGSSALPGGRMSAARDATPLPAPAPGARAAASTSLTAALITAQNQARKLYSPSLGQTYCNESTCYIGQKMRAPMGPLEDAQGHPYLANRIAQNLAASALYRDLTPEEAQQFADEGHLVIGAWYNPAGHGHVVTVRPAGVPGDVPMGRSGPLLNDIGRQDEVRPAEHGL